MIKPKPPESRTDAVHPSRFAQALHRVRAVVRELADSMVASTSRRRRSKKPPAPLRRLPGHVHAHDQMRTVGPYVLDDCFFPFANLSTLRFWHATRRLDDQTRECLIARPRPDMPTCAFYDDWRQELGSDIEEIRAMRHDALLPLLDFNTFDGIPIVEMQSFDGVTIRQAASHCGDVVRAVQIVDQIAAIPFEILSKVYLTSDSILLVRPDRVCVVPPFRRILDDIRGQGRRIVSPSPRDFLPIPERGSVRGVIYHLASILFALVRGNGQHIDGWGTPLPSFASLSHADSRMLQLEDLFQYCISGDFDDETHALAQFREHLARLGSVKPGEIGGIIDAVLCRRDAA